MATYQITGPDGKKYRVTGDSPQGAAAALKKHLGTSSTSGVGDALKSFGSGIAQGALDLAGLPGTIDNALTSGLDWAKSRAYEAVTGEEPTSGFFAPMDNSRRPLGGRNPLSGSVLREAASGATGGATEYEPQTTTGEYAQTIGSFLPGAAAFGGAGAGNLTRFGVLPGAASEAAGQATEGSAIEPYARTAAALIAPAIPSMAARAVTPFPTDPNRSRMVEALSREGVPVTAGQRAGSDRLRYMESEIGGAGASRIMGNQQEQFTAAALRRAGINANRATPEVIDDAFSRIGSEFDNLAANNELIPDPQMVSSLRTTFNNYGQMVPESARAPIVENLTNDIVSTIQRNGRISGEAYQRLRSRVDRARRGTRDPELGDALQGIRETLDDAMERSIAQRNPSDVGRWREARNQYRNMIVLEKAATGAGENAASGLISPSQLRNATVVGQGRRNYARGRGDFAELARAGESVLKPLPNSGTAGRLSAQNLGTNIGALLGGGAGAAISQSPAGAIGGMLAGAAIPRVAGAAMMSRPGQAYLSNQLFGAVPAADRRYAAIVEALLASSDQPSGQLQ